jgi:excinuclease UvrABC ATPase subunit
VFDIGPGAGRHGGEIVSEGTLKFKKTKYVNCRLAQPVEKHKVRLKNVEKETENSSLQRSIRK